MWKVETKQKHEKSTRQHESPPRRENKGARPRSGPSPLSRSSDITKPMQLATHSQWLTASDRRGSRLVSKQDLPPEMPGQAGQTGAQARKWVLCLRAHGLLLIPLSPKLPRQSLPLISVHLCALLVLVRDSLGCFFGHPGLSRNQGLSL